MATTTETVKWPVVDSGQTDYLNIYCVCATFFIRCSSFDTTAAAAPRGASEPTTIFAHLPTSQRANRLTKT